MVRRDGVDDNGGLAKAFNKTGADGGVAALVVTLDCLADVMQQAGALGQARIEPDLASQHRAQKAHLNGVIERVLRVGEPVLEATEQLDDLGVQAVDAKTLHGVLTRLLHVEFHVLKRSLVKILDGRRVDSPVLDQALQGNARYLTPHRVKRRNQHHLGRLVDEQRHAGSGLEGFDVTPLAPNDAPLHLLTWQLDDGRGDVVVRLGGQPLHRGHQNALGLGIQILFRAIENLMAQGAQLVLALQLNLLTQRSLDLLGVHLGHPLKALAHRLGQRAHGVTGLGNGGGLAGQSLALLLKLIVE